MDKIEEYVRSKCFELVSTLGKREAIGFMEFVLCNIMSKEGEYKDKDEETCTTHALLTIAILAELQEYIEVGA
jgi:hypothetical protein